MVTRAARVRGSRARVAHHRATRCRRSRLRPRPGVATVAVGGLAVALRLPSRRSSPADRARTPDRLIPIVGILRETSLDHRLEAGRAARGSTIGVGLLGQNPLERLEGVVPWNARLRRWLRRAHNQTRRCLFADRAAGRVLVPATCSRPYRSPPPGVTVGVLPGRRQVGAQLRHTEVEHLGVAAVGDHQVLGLQIAMDHAGRMGRAQRVDDLQEVLERPLRSRRLASMAFRSVSPDTSSIAI